MDSSANGTWGQEENVCAEAETVSKYREAGEEVGNMGNGPECPLVPFQESGAARNMNPFPSRRS